VIVVIGEALVDLVVEPDGRVTPTLGGAPFNTACACARLGSEVAYVGAISVDRFGTMLLARLEADGVTTGFVERCDLPTTLAVAELDEHGAATYRFYVDGTSAPSFDSTFGDLVPSFLFSGGLALELEPMALTVEALIVTRSAECAVMLDVNCRPKMIRDRDRYLERVTRLIARSDVVKVSDDDLAYLMPDHDPLAAARAVLAHGPQVVLLTAGGSTVQVLARDGETAVPVLPVQVVDTIGAGDAFSAGFLSWWVASGRANDQLGSLEQVLPAVRAAIEVAAAVCTRRGADPPWRNELPDAWSPGG
jgi:fructokinase